MRIAFLLLIVTARVLAGQPSENVSGSICGLVLDGERQTGLACACLRNVTFAWRA